ncbi:hypothetical protein [Brevundimonas aurantiaca]|uniref:hypothetical protein n=1 Tax=Brevundimonas aurantiaca TaxID=74316 RepID=UPI001CD1ADD0|nr:hypothetical protein [Brevundimonas aurantiaca]
MVTVLVGGWLFGLGHFIFLGVGMSQAWALALIALLILVLVRPLAPMRGEASGTPSSWSHTLAGLSTAVLILGCGLSLAARHAEPASAVDVAAE